MVALALVDNVVPMTHQDKFDEFWKMYPSPRRTGKAICRAKWNAIVSPTGLRTRTLDRDSGVFISLTLSATPEAILAGLRRHVELWQDKATYGWKEGGKFIPMPATWLNQGRWED